MALTGMGLLNPKATFLDDNGNPLAAGLVYIYAAGTTTPQTTYSEALLLVPNANPVVLDAAGRAVIFFDPTLAYKIIVKNSAGATIYTQDHIAEPNQGIDISGDGTTWLGRVLGVGAAAAGIGQNLTINSFTTTMNKAASGTHTSFIGTAFYAPTIGGGGATVANSANLLVAGAATGALANYSLYVQSGGNGIHFEDAISFLTDVSQGITFNDSRVTGVVSTTVRGYVGPLLDQFRIGSLTNSPLTLAYGGNAVFFLDGTTITLDHGADDTELLRFRNSDVAHGFTTDTATNIYATFRKASATDGGLSVAGYTEGSLGVLFAAQYTTGNTTKDATGAAAIVMVANKLSGSTAGAMGANENILALRNNTGTRFIFDAEGDMFYDGSAPANYDQWDDVGLTRALDQTFRGPDFVETAFDAFVKENRTDLERAGIVTNGGMVCMTKHTRLLNGAIWQLSLQIRELNNRIAQLEG